MRQVCSFLCLLILMVAAAGSSVPPPSKGTDEGQLLAMHEAVLRAHLDSDIGALLAGQAGDFILVNRGELFMPTMQQRRDVLGPYLAATEFEFYRDRTAPVVKIAADGSLGWVAAEVEARGTQVTADGERQLIEFVVAWVELYERQGGEWIAIGNASSFKPDD